MIRSLERFDQCGATGLGARLDRGARADHEATLQSGLCFSSFTFTTLSSRPGEACVEEWTAEDVARFPEARARAHADLAFLDGDDS